MTAQQAPRRKKPVIAKLQRHFEAFAESRGSIFFAPGRINLIGEHTDYSGGFVLPASIGLGTWAAVGPREDHEIRVHSEAQNETVSFTLSAIARTEPMHWSDYVKAIAWALQKQGHPLRGAELLIGSNLPLGSGLSSSASLEVAVAMALLSQAEIALPPMPLAQLCQMAENDFVGARCGLMDQFAATHGIRNTALLLNCSTLHWQTVPLPADFRWVVANTMVHHSLASGEYNTRRTEVEQLQERLRRTFPQHQYLYQLTDVEAGQLAAELPDTLKRRLRHIVSENHRVLNVVSSLQSNDMKAVGRLLSASHRSLRDDFEVSCRELDIMAELARHLPGVLGARMLGGGFGGCVLSLVESTQVETFVDTLGREYRRALGIDPWIHVCDIEEGAHRVA